MSHAGNSEDLGALAFRRALPNAIRTLENDELRALLLALLEEWRWRAQGAVAAEQDVMPGSAGETL
jgi:hypothetical protein